jgi:hypothetical protein
VQELPCQKFQQEASRKYKIQQACGIYFFFCEKDFLLLKQQDYNHSSIEREYQQEPTQAKFETASEYDQNLPTHGLHYFAHG